MRKLLAAALCMATLWTAGCAGAPAYQKYSYAFLGTFDTLTQVVGYARSQEEFDGWAKKAQARFEELSRLYDIYNDYEGVSNIKTINDSAGRSPVAVRREIIDLILFCKDWQARTPAAVNIALGAALRLWHDAREEGLKNPETAKLPPMDALREAAKHADMAKVVVDEAGGTVFLADPEMRLDVGSVAKGYAAELVAKELESAGWRSFVIDSGGNVRAGGGPLDGKRDKWAVGITDPASGDSPDASPTLDTAYVTNLSLTTAGDYQRYYTVDGKRYCHIIDPQTLLPAERFRAVTVAAASSAVADFLDTALFLLPYEQGRELVGSLEGVEALWVLPDGSLRATPGMQAMLKTMGGAKDKR